MVRWHSEAEMWSLIVRYGLPRFRWFRHPVSLTAADLALDGHPDWPPLRSELMAGDKIWPFRYPRSLRVWGHREGFVVLRGGQFIGGIVTISS